MEEYILKSALVAEIEKLYDEKGTFYAADVLYNLKEWLDTLEVVEVDLDFTKEVDMWIENNGDTNGFFNVQDLAKHFYELGLSASNKAQEGE